MYFSLTDPLSLLALSGRHSRFSLFKVHFLFCNNYLMLFRTDVFFADRPVRSLFF